MTWNRRAVLGRAGIVAGIGALGLGSASAGVGATAGDAVLEGRVTHFGRPVPNAVVKIVGEAGTEAETETDDRGRFERAVPTGTYGFEVRADGFAPERAVLTLEGSEATAVEFSLERAWGPGEGELEVFATAVGGGPTIPCEMTLYGDEKLHTRAPRGSVPDDENWGRGFAVSEGWWDVLVTDAAGYGDGSQEVYVGGGETAVAAVELPEGDREIPREGTLEGRVTDPHGEPISNALVRADTRITGVDDEGAFDLALENGSYEVTVAAVGYRSRDATVRVRFGSTTRLTIALEPADE